MAQAPNPPSQISQILAQIKAVLPLLGGVGLIALGAADALVRIHSGQAVDPEDIALAAGGATLLGVHINANGS